MATYVSFAVLYICIHILNTLIANPIEGTSFSKNLFRECLFLAVDVFIVAVVIFIVARKKFENPEIEIMNCNSGIQIQ